MIKVRYFALLTLFTGCSLFEGPEGKVSLLDVSDEPAGQNCSLGGVKISSGVDSNQNGTLDATEIKSTKYVCTAAAGNTGTSSLIATEEIAPGNICSSGGLQVDSGRDLNHNGILENAEVEVTKYVCNGMDGLVDKQIRITLPSSLSSYDATMVASGAQHSIHKFNIDHFVGVDSVIYTIWSSVSDSGNKATIELYNLTDNVPIAGSQIIAGPGLAMYESSNLKNSFPHKEITLGVRLKGDLPGQVTAYFGYLYLYRK